MILIKPQGSQWVEETHPTEFDHDINDLGWIGLDFDPLVGVAPSMSSTSHASTTTTSIVAYVLEESNKSELDDSVVAHAEDPISSSGDKFDDSC